MSGTQGNRKKCKEKRKRWAVGAEGLRLAPAVEKMEEALWR